VGRGREEFVLQVLQGLEAAVQDVAFVFLQDVQPGQLERRERRERDVLREVFFVTNELADE